MRGAPGWGCLARDRGSFQTKDEVEDEDEDEVEDEVEVDDQVQVHVHD